MSHTNKFSFRRNFMRMNLYFKEKRTFFGIVEQVEQEVLNRRALSIERKDIAVLEL
jgi:hypothetical protein